MQCLVASGKFVRNQFFPRDTQFQKRAMGGVGLDDSLGPMSEAVQWPRHIARNRRVSLKVCLCAERQARAYSVAGLFSAATEMQAANVHGYLLDPGCS